MGLALRARPMLKLLAQLLSQLYSTRSNYWYLFGSFLDQQLWRQLPIAMWLECSGECRYVQDHPFMHFCQEILDPSLCFPMGTLQNHTSTAASRERACIVVFPFLPKSIASWISFCQVLLRASYRTTGIFGPHHHYRLTLIFVALR